MIEIFKDTCTSTIESVPIDLPDIVNILPGSANSNGVLIEKLKRKLSYRLHFYLKAIQPNTIFNSVLYLNQNNICIYGRAIVSGNIVKLSLLSLLLSLLENNF